MTLQEYLAQDPRDDDEKAFIFVRDAAKQMREEAYPDLPDGWSEIKLWLQRCYDENVRGGWPRWLYADLWKPPLKPTERRTVVTPAYFGKRRS